MDNTGKAWGTSSAIKGYDGVFAPPSCTFLWFYFFRLAKNLEKQAKFLVNTEIVFHLLIFLFRICYYMHTALQDNQKLNNSARITKNDVKI